MGSADMDQETLQALIEVYKARASTDLLSIIMDEAEGQQGRAAVLELLRTLTQETLSNEDFAPLRRKACQFCLNAADFELAERLARSSEQPEDRAMRARALHGLGREQEAVALYRLAITQDPAMRNRELERILGIRPGSNISAPPAKVISLTNYSSKRDARYDHPREIASDTFLEEIDDSAVTFADVAGLDDIKTEIQRRIVLPYLKPTLFERYRQKPGGNLLLYGPPGCGKTLIARAAAGACDARFLSVTPEEILDKYAGEAEKRLRVFFDEARSDPPAIIFFDDFEVLAFKRNTASTEAAPALISAFLSELDGTLRNNSGILVIAATNAPWLLDPALFRSGRFHRVILVPAPSFDDRKKILSAAMPGVPGHDKVALDRIARKTAGLSGADLRALVDWVNNLTLKKAIAGSPEGTITTALFEEGLKLFRPSTTEWVNRARTEIKSMKQQEGFYRHFDPLYRI